jgi:hypothetical protein
MGTWPGKVIGYGRASSWVQRGVTRSGKEVE